jgi:uncharacterized membrane protein
MNALRATALVSAAASGVMGGVLFAFSSFVMPALRRLPETDAVAAMQAINVAAPRALGLPLLVSGAGSAAVGIWVVSRGDSPMAAKVLLVSGAVTAVTALAITAGYHVPRNNALDAVDAASRSAAGAWDAYYPGWVAMNHVRTALSLASAAFVIAGVARLP